MDSSAYTLTELCKEADTTLYRGHGGIASAPFLLVVANIGRPDAAGRIAREYGLAHGLDRAWALRPHELTSHDGRGALVLEDPGGCPLQSLLAKPLEVASCLRLGLGMAWALRQVHGSGIIHLDLRPSNIFIGADHAVRLTGFGSALLTREKGGDDNAQGFVPGHYEYMSPEQSGRAQRAPDQRSDLYALGAIMYEMLTGAIPFNASDATEWIHCHIARQPVPPKTKREDAPLALSDIILKLLAKSPEERYQTAAGLEHDLKYCLSEWSATEEVGMFALGVHDTADAMVLPRNLYGREGELEALATSFNRVAEEGGGELFLISGYSGVGKSSIVDAFLTSVGQSDAIVACGKSDQYRSDIPYSTLTAAFAEVVDKLLRMSDGELAPWREAILEALGPNGQLMVSLIPQLELVIGVQPQVAQVSPWDQQARFQRVFRRFIDVFARNGRPLVLFLDDLQWLDAGTLALLEALISDGGMRNLLVVGVYRENEIGNDHPLASALQRIRLSGRPMVEVTLSPLTKAHLTELVAETLTTSAVHSKQLAELVFEKTEGNPFFAIQFLHLLADQGLLRFDHSNGQWLWELGSIRKQAITENVATILAAKFERLAEPTQVALGIMASFGSPAEFRTLKTILGGSDEECRAALQMAVNAGFIHLNGEFYEFLHDRLQEAAYSFIPVEKRGAVHLNIARAMFSSLSAVELDENIFAVAGQFNRCQSLVTAASERELVAQLNLFAAKRAKISTAYLSALEYTKAAVAMLTAERWEMQYDLTFALAILEGECKLLIGALADTLRLAEIIKPNCRTKTDQALVCCLQSDVHVIRSDYASAIKVTSDCLVLFGIDIPADPTRMEVDKAFANIWTILDGRSISGLVDLPRTEDPDVEATMRILQALFTPAGLHDSNLLYLVLCNMVEITVKHGTTPASPIGLGWFGMALGHVFGIYGDALQFGLLASAIVERNNFLAEKAKTDFCLQMLLVWSRPVSEGLDTVRSAFTTATSTGDVITACFSAVHIVADRLLRGDNLQAILEEIRQTLAFARNARYRDVIDCIVIQERFVQTMRGETPSFSSFDGEGFDTELFEAQFTPDRMSMMTFFYWTSKGAARYLSGDLDEAAEALQHALELVPKSHGHIQRGDIAYYTVLTRAALLESAISPDDVAIHQQEIEFHADLLQKWTGTCPETFADRNALAHAEIARLKGQELTAMQLYDDAIELSRRNGFIQNEAIGNELAAKFHRCRGAATIADAYLAKARECYSEWGAHGKVRQLDQLHPRNSDGKALPTLERVTLNSFERLDRSTIISISQAISSEIDLRKLIEALMKVALQDSGGERAVLVLVQQADLQIEAEGRIVDGSIGVRFPETPVVPTDLPMSILRYVMRSGDSVLIDDAVDRNPYAADPYFTGEAFRSVLCVPIVKYQKAIGALYVENNHLSRVFTPERREILSLVGLQAGISLENARLFRHVQQITSVSRRAESELKHSIDLIPALVWSVYSSGRGAVFNRQWHDYTGISPEVARDGGWIASFHPDDREKVMVKWRELVDHEIAGEVEARLVRTDGTSRYFLVRAAPLRDDEGVVVKWYGTNTDIDDLKRSEQLVFEERRLLEMVGAGDALPRIIDELSLVLERFIERSVALVILFDPESRRIVQCQAPSAEERFARTILERSQAGMGASLWEQWAIRQETTFCAAVEDQPTTSPFRDLALENGFRACWSTPILSFDRRLLGRFGVLFRSSRGLMPHEIKIAEQLVRLAGIIIERKQAEDALRKSATLLADGEMISHAGSWTWNAATRRVSWSAECARIFGFAPDERGLPYEAVLQRIHPDDRPLIEARRAATQPSGDASFEHRILLSDGSVKLVHARDKVSFDSTGAVAEYFVTVLDITDRKKNDDEMRRLVSLIENSNECIAYAASIYDITYVNDAWRRTIGLDLDEDLASYQMGDFLTAEAFAALTGHVLPILLREGHWQGECSLRHLLTGEVIPVHKTIFFILDSKTGERNGIATICRDITEQKRMNGNLQASLKEKEALLKEVHHRVKNNLQLISSLLSLQAERIDDAGVSELFAESRDRVRSMALVHENLYRAGNFANISMQTHVQNLCANLMHAYSMKGQNVELVTFVDDMELDLDRAVSIGLIINELVSNSLKHGYPDGRRGRVEVQLKALEDGSSVLSVGDDGVGMPEDFDSDQADTLGLQLVHDLTDQLHGTIEVFRQSGTIFTVTFGPLPKAAHSI
ncbi:AAA family ATPase [Pararhizobium sp. DWP1-1-3]|uniref:AAA family ATPase n=1 Tax=Pararhizobium sp. DWP1-1-3 TaxID=2804652 RepID=UPI003CFA4DA5